MVVAKKTGPGSDKPFKWECLNGETIELPSLSTIDPDLGAAADMAAAATVDNDLVTMGLHVKFLMASLPDGKGKELRQLKSSEFGDFMEAWSDHSGVSMGE